MGSIDSVVKPDKRVSNPVRAGDSNTGSRVEAAMQSLFCLEGWFAGTG
jgi:hypothetical protein